MLPILFCEEGRRTRSVSLEADASTVWTALFLGIDFIKKRSFLLSATKKARICAYLSSKEGSRAT
jgi:hypothetical protein